MKFPLFFIFSMFSYYPFASTAEKPIGIPYTCVDLTKVEYGKLLKKCPIGKKGCLELDLFIYKKSGSWDPYIKINSCVNVKIQNKIKTLSLYYMLTKPGEGPRRYDKFAFVGIDKVLTTYGELDVTTLFSKSIDLEPMGDYRGYESRIDVQIIDINRNKVIYDGGYLLHSGNTYFKKGKIFFENNGNCYEYKKGRFFAGGNCFKKLLAVKVIKKSKIPKNYRPKSKYYKGSKDLPFSGFRETTWQYFDYYLSKDHLVISKFSIP